MLHYSKCSYYPFGMNMPGRKFSSLNQGYRYGFNGKELDKEVAGTTTYDYGFRIYSPGLGRFLSVDPLSNSYPSLTPYQFASNSPILNIDIDGLEGGRYLTPDSKTILLPTNAEVLKKFTETAQMRLKGFDKTVNVSKGQLQAFQIGSKLYEANWNVKSGSFLGYFSNGEKYLPETEPNIGIVKVIDEVIREQYIPGNPPQERIWEMPAIFDYDKALENDLTPDAVTRSLGADVAGATYGGSGELTATTILKGNDASIFSYYSLSKGLGAQLPIDLGVSIGASLGSVWSLEKAENYLYTRSMIEGPQVSGSFSIGGSLGAKGAINFTIDLSLRAGISDVIQGKKKVEATSITIKVGASVGESAVPGIKASGSVRYGESTSAWHPFDWLE